MKRNVLKLIAFFIVGMVGGIFSDQILWPYFIERPLFYQYGLDERPIYVTERNDIYIQENTALKDAIEKVEKAVVGVRTKSASGKILEGSGLSLTNDGLLVTLAELVPAGSSFTLFVNGEEADFTVVKRDLNKNLVLLKLDGVSLATVAFADSAQVKLGERVFLFGFVFDKSNILKTVNEGIIKRFNENYLETNIIEDSDLKGSALFNIEGLVLGINTINSEGSIIAIPISQVREFAEL